MKKTKKPQAKICAKPAAEKTFADQAEAIRIFSPARAAKLARKPIFRTDTRIFPPTVAYAHSQLARERSEEWETSSFRFRTLERDETGDFYCLRREWETRGIGRVRRNFFNLDRALPDAWTAVDNNANHMRIETFEAHVIFQERNGGEVRSAQLCATPASDFASLAAFKAAVSQLTRQQQAPSRAFSIRPLNATPTAHAKALSNAFGRATTRERLMFRLGFTAEGLALKESKELGAIMSAPTADSPGTSTARPARRM